MAQLKAKDDVFIGEIDGTNGVWQRRKAKKGKKGKNGANALLTAHVSHA